MFKEIADKHNKQSKENRKSMQSLEDKITKKSLPAYNKALFADLNEKCTEIVKNQNEIDSKCIEVKNNWDKFNNDLTKWTTSINDLNTAVLSIGDIRSWSQSIQKQIEECCDQLAKMK